MATGAQPAELFGLETDSWPGGWEAVQSLHRRT